MTNKVETIMSTVFTRLSALTTTGSNVDRDTPYDLASDLSTYLDVTQGSCVRITDAWPVEDWELTLFTDMYARKSSTEAPSTIVNRIWNEIVVAMEPNPLSGDRLGLSYVEAITEDGTLPIEKDYGTVPLCAMRLTWRIQFRRDVNDPGA